METYLEMLNDRVDVDPRADSHMNNLMNILSGKVGSMKIQKERW